MQERRPWPGSEEPKVLIDRIIARAVVPLAVNHGFRRSSRTWRRQTAGGLLQFLHVQASPWNRRAWDYVETTRASFTLNLGIYVPGLHELGVAPLRERPRGEHDCHVQLRVGQLLGCGDIWWDVGHAHHMERVANEVEDTLRMKVFPWFDQCSTLGNLVDWINGGPELLLFWQVRVGLALLVGDEAKAQAEMDGLEIVSPDLAGWAQRHGLKPPPADRF